MDVTAQVTRLADSLFFLQAFRHSDGTTAGGIGHSIRSRDTVAAIGLDDIMSAFLIQPFANYVLIKSSNP